MERENEKVSWFEKNPKKTIFGFTGISILILLILVEVALRLIGFKPGQYNESGYFNEIDTLILYPEFDVDENGIMKVSYRGAVYVDSLIGDKSSGANRTMIDTIKKDSLHEWSIKRLVIDNLKLNPEIDYKNNFSDFVDSLAKLPPTTLNDCQKAVLAYAHKPINGHGFRGIDLKEYPGEGKKVMLIGDSFTWGLSANPISSCFADELLAKGYVVYNLGAIGVDPAQYLAIAEKYVQELKPDIVIVNFFMGNDIMYHYREPKAGQLPLYPSNAGWLVADVLGDYLPPESIYRYIRTKLEIPDQDKHLINRLFGLTVIGSKTWLALVKLGLAPQTSDEFLELETRYEEQTKDKKIVSESYISDIHRIANSNNCKFLLTVIEDRMVCNPLAYNIKPTDVFKQEKFLICNEISDNYYNPCGDGHFNNEGHQIFANFLQTKIDSILAH